MLGLRGGRPGAHPRAGARPQQIDRTIRPIAMPLALRRHMFLMRPPAEFGGLQPFRDEAFNRPCVDEDAHGLRRLGALRVAFGDMNALHADVAAQAAPIPRGSSAPSGLEADVARDIEQSLLDEPRHHAWIGAAAGDRRRAGPERLALVEHFLAKRIVRALRQREPRVDVEARPGLADRVDIERTQFMREADDRGGGNFDREIDDESLARSLGEQRLQQIDEIFPRHGLFDESDSRARRRDGGRCRPDR